MTSNNIREGDRVVVVGGKYRGRHGRVALTHDSAHRIVVRLLALQAGLVRVVLDRDASDGSWSGVMPVADLRRTRLETDAEMHARWGHERREVTIFESATDPEVLPVG